MGQAPGRQGGSGGGQGVLPPTDPAPQGLSSTGKKSCSPAFVGQTKAKGISRFEFLLLRVGVCAGYMCVPCFCLSVYTPSHTPLTLSPHNALTCSPHEAPSPQDGESPRRLSGPDQSMPYADQAQAQVPSKAFLLPAEPPSPPQSAGLWYPH